jgi:hypothetical protein
MIWHHSRIQSLKKDASSKRFSRLPLRLRTGYKLHCALRKSTKLPMRLVCNLSMLLRFEAHQTIQIIREDKGKGKRSFGRTACEMD